MPDSPHFLRGSDVGSQFHSVSHMGAPAVKLVQVPHGPPPILGRILFFSHIQRNYPFNFHSLLSFFPPTDIILNFSNKSKDLIQGFFSYLTLLMSQIGENKLHIDVLTLFTVSSACQWKTSLKCY